MEEYKDLNLVGYLYNKCYGGFTFSDAFLKRLNKCRREEGLEPIPAYRKERTDPMVITLFQEMGREASSGPCSNLKIFWVPDEFLRFVYCDEYDGKESVSVVKSEVYADLLENFLKERETKPELTLDDLEARYHTVKAKLARYDEFLKKVYWV